MIKYKNQYRFKKNIEDAIQARKKGESKYFKEFRYNI